MKTLLLVFIKTYQYILSPIFMPACRFHPTCSQYAHEAIKRYGVLKGFVMAGKRILRCHPCCPGGFDPVP
ncbi:MAG: membrane protein insertion efficiency factor YidD [Deltaproteobacteria bacterium]|nr:membrane protein insertion efficiency factor YidD [Deltaproteobacteria bacterium]MBW2600925.1 membrane protein insertion efficiency factor YidD [Deltaproteobacteria bacterium]